jgi:cysteine sulfinate desulfinase/cysteine desulfurase-like protein
MDKNEMMHYLNKYNIIVNTGSACNAGSDRSDVLQALGLSDAAEQSTIRVSLSPLTTWGECQLLVDTMQNMLNNLPARRPTTHNM